MPVPPRVWKIGEAVPCGADQMSSDIRTTMNEWIYRRGGHRLIITFSIAII